MFRRLGLKTEKNERGLASIVVVGVLIVLLTVISLGFARIMQRTAQNSLNDQTAAAATYAAQSGINDLATYIRSNPTVKAENCKDLIGTASSKGPFYTASNLSGDRNSEYTCILLNQRPDSLYYQQIPVLESKVVKMTTDSTTGSVDKILVSWQATDRSKTVPAPLSNVLPDVTTWNSADYAPMLRVTLYPVTTAGSIAPIQGASRTMFLSPRAGSSGASDTIGYPTITEGGIQPVACSNDLSDASDDPSFLVDNDVTNFTDLANMDCNLAITGLSDIPNIDYFYLRAVPIYSNIDFELRAKDIDDRTVKFRGVQAVLDVTAKVGPASKRLQARVDIGSNPANGTDPLVPSPNVGPDDTIPEHALRTANAICKRFLFTDGPYRYISFDGTSASCNQSSGLLIPAPTLSFKINCLTVSAGTCIDSETIDAFGQKGTYYMMPAGSTTAQFAWQVTDAPSCSGSGGSPGWPGNKTPGFWSGSTGTSSETRNDITSVTTFNLRCIGANGTPVEKSVIAWPHPIASIAVPPNHEAGQTFRVSWSSQHATRCVLEGNWANLSDTRTSGFQDISTNFFDNSAKFFKVTCYDPANRPAVAGNTSGPVGSPGRSDPTAPVSLCDADWNISDNGNGTGTLTWEGQCPRGNPGAGYYRFTDCNANMTAFLGGVCGDVGNSRNAVVGAGEYCGNYWAGADPWGWFNPSGYKCFTIAMPPISIINFDDSSLGAAQTIVAWDNSPYCWSPGNGWHQTWWCYGQLPVGPPSAAAGYWDGDTNKWSRCANGTHRWTICTVDWQATTGVAALDAQITCDVYTIFGRFTGGGRIGFTGPWGWEAGGGPGPNGTFHLVCNYPGSPGPAEAWR